MELRSGDPMLAFDADLRVFAWNDAAEKATGVTREDAIGRYCWEILCALDGGGHLVCHAGCSYARLAREGWEVPTRELSVKTDEGRRAFAVSTLSMRDGGPPVFVHLMRAVEQAAPRSREPRIALSKRQREILTLLGEGVPAKVIAARLGLAEVTVRNHIRALLRKLGCHSQLEAVAVARRDGLLES